MSGFTYYHSQYLAYRITLAGIGDNILLIVPASLRKQWAQELFDKFSSRS